MIRFNFLGFPTTVHPFFWLGCAILGMAHFTEGREGLIALAIWFSVAFISVLWHELGHALTFKKYGASSRISLVAFGGLCTPSRGGFTNRQQVEISAAGPVFNFILAALIYSITFFIPKESVVQIAENQPVVAVVVEDNFKYLRHFISIAVTINVAWGILNLAPIMPLDGGRILSALMPARKAGLVPWIGIIFAILIAILGAITGKLFATFLFGFLAFENWQAIQKKRYRGY